MGAEDNGLTLEGLAHKLEALQRENSENTQRLETLERENAELRHEVTAPRGSGTRRNAPDEARSLVPRRDGERSSQFDGQVSRRALLGKAGAAAVAAMAAGTLMYPRQAKANHYGSGIDVNWIDTHHLLSEASTVGDRAIVALNTADDAGAVFAENSGSGPAVRALGGTGVWGSSSTTGQSGVYGQHTGTAGYGVVGDGKGNGAGVVGRNSGGEGVRGEGSTTAEVAGVRGLGKTGVWGSSSATGYSGVYGQHTGSAGYGVVGDGKGTRTAGVLGRNKDGAFGYGVQGEGSTGVYGTSNVGGAGTGVKGENTSTIAGYGVYGVTQVGTGVFGFSRTDGPGVEGLASTGSEAGVLGRNRSGGTGVKGEGQTGVWGAGPIGVRGDGEVFGVRGESTQAGTSGIYGRNDSGIGAQGNGKTGVLGISSGGGYGGQFEGGKAQLMLKPAGTLGKPTTGTHTKGEIYMDKAGALFVCTAGDGTTVGTWKKVNMQLV